MNANLQMIHSKWTRIRENPKQTSMQLIAVIVLCVTLYFALKGLLAYESNSHDLASSSSDINSSSSSSSSGLAVGGLQWAKANQTTSVDSPEQLVARIIKLDRLADETIAEGHLAGDAWDHKGLPGGGQLGATLRQVLLVQRHGDRSPTDFQASDPLASEPFWEFHGHGQLTNRGKARAFMLGAMVRQRYNRFLENSVSKLNLISRSSASLRCLESGQLFLAGLLSLEQPIASLEAALLNWGQGASQKLGHLWQPVAVQSVPVKVDGMLAEGAECRALEQEYAAIDASNYSRQILANYQTEAAIMNSTIGYKLEHFWQWLWATSLIDIERTYFPDKLKPQLEQVFGRIQEAASLAMVAYQATNASKRLRGGLLIDDIILHMDRARNNWLNSTIEKTRQNQAEPKLVHYVGHDLTLIVLLGLLDSIGAAPSSPHFAANMAIELHQNNPPNQHEWFLRVYYMPKVPSEPIEIHFERCEQAHPRKQCTLDKFAELMQPFRIDSWLKWMIECKNDQSKLNLYA